MGQMAYPDGTYRPDDSGIRKRRIHCKDQLYRTDCLFGREPAPGSPGNGCQSPVFHSLPTFQSPEDFCLLERMERKVETCMGMGNGICSRFRRMRSRLAQTIRPDTYYITKMEE